MRGYWNIYDELGYFEINNLKPGVYNLQASFIGYKKRIFYEIELTNSREVYKKILLEEGSNYLEEVGVSAREFSPDETPISFKAIGVSEIKRNPGGNRDISKVMQTFLWPQVLVLEMTSLLGVLRMKMFFI